MTVSESKSSEANFNTKLVDPVNGKPEKNDNLEEKFKQVSIRESFEQSKSCKNKNSPDNSLILCPSSLQWYEN